MIVSTLRIRDSLRPEDCEVPTRPNVEATHLGQYKNSNDGTLSEMYRISLIQKSSADAPTHEEKRKPLTAHQRNTLYSSLNSIDVVQLEIFGCVQRQNQPEITRWKQIAQTDLRTRKKKNGKERRCSIFNLSDGTTRSSVKIAGFSPGFRYQIVVRGVDARGNRSLFSQPVFIVPT